MAQATLDILRRFDAALALAMRKGIGAEGLRLDLDPSASTDPELQAIGERLTGLFAMLNESQQFANRLAAGDLEAVSSRSNVFSMPLKALQASLRHLTWQAEQVAAGDLQQQVHFLGDFSHSFNRMIASLREKQSLEKRLQTITDVLGEGVYLVDTDGRLNFMNPEAERLLEYRFDELAGKTIHQIICGQHPNGVRFSPQACPLVQSLSEGREFKDVDSVFTCKSGRLLPVALISRPIFEDDRHTGAVVAFHDISEQKKYQESLETINQILEKQASTDPLTGIYNRLKLSQQVDSELKRAQRYHSELAVILFDIDHFKRINDNYGHLTGDAVLQDMARVVTKNLRDSDIFARWGGEEFMIVLPGTSVDQARTCAEKLRGIIAGHPFPVPTSVTVSLGVTGAIAEDSRETLTNRADQALYAAKENGRNRVECG